MRDNPSFSQDFQKALRATEKYCETAVWAPLEQGQFEKIQTRNLFTYILAICETGRRLNRLPDLLRTARDTQNLCLYSATYGNFWWTCTSGYVRDPNSAEFCMRGASLTLLRHRELLEEHHLLDKLRDMMLPALIACIHGPSPAKYTNMTLMNAMNLILLGQVLEDSAAKKEGEWRFDQFYLYTWNWGIHEFCSPTYSAIQLYCLGLIERFAESVRIREQASALLELFWTAVAYEWLTEADRLGGTYSREVTLHLAGEARIEGTMQTEGLLSAKSLPLHLSTNLYQALTRWNPFPIFKRVRREPYPRLLQQGWGPRPEQCRTVFEYPSVWLSTLGANYDFPSWEDITLAADFNLPRDVSSPKGYRKPPIYYPGRFMFLPAAQDISPSALRKQYHYSPPLWTAAQNKNEALCLVLYKEVREAPSNKSIEFQSLLILADSIQDSVWIGDQCYVTKHMKKDVVLSVAEDQTLIFRKDHMAIGVRAVWNTPVKTITFLYMPAEHGGSDSVLKISYKGGENRAEGVEYSGSAFLVRIGEGLDSDQKFQQWQEAFAAEKVSVTENTELAYAVYMDIRVERDKDPLSVQTTSEDFARFETHLTPPPSRDVLKENGKDLGRDILKGQDILRRYEKELNDQPVVEAPGYWNADQGRVWFPMTAEKVPVAGEVAPYVWVSPDYAIQANPGGERASDVGSVTWQLDIPRRDTYFIWGHVDTLLLQHRPFHEGPFNAFLARIFCEIAQPLYMGSWLFENVQQGWTWWPLALNNMEPLNFATALQLPQGTVNLQLFAQTYGIKIDRLFITADPNIRPAD